jgi:hypothetical protein
MLLGEMIDELAKLRAEKRGIEKLAEEVDAKAKALEQELLTRLDADASEGARSGDWTATVSKSVVPHVTDWEAFHQFIYENKWLHLLERRPSTTGCRELFQQNQVVPGVESFTKRSIRLSNRSKVE